MDNQSFTTTLLVDRTSQEVFNAINNVRAWWPGEIEGNSNKLNDEFTYRYKEFHYSRQKLIEVNPDEKVVWLVTDSSLNFVADKSEWTGTKISFEISENDNKTQIRFTHMGLVPEYECFDACSNAWTDIIHNSLHRLITTGKGQPGKKLEEPMKEKTTMETNDTTLTTQEVAARFNELAQQEKWFEIQDEFFSDNVKSIEPPTAKYLRNAEGKAAVRKKGEEWVKRVEAFHGGQTTNPVVAGNYFAVGRKADITVQELGRLQIDQVMLYEVKDGQIVLEQFFY